MDQELNYIPVDLNVLRIDKLKPFDIYLKTGKRWQGFVLYSRRGSYFTERIRQTLLLNGIATIYVPEKNRDVYQQYVEDNLQHIIKDKNIPPAEKSKIVYDSSRYLMEQLFENPRANMFSRTKKTVNNIVRLILSDRETTTNLIRISEYDYYTYTHSVNVGILSVAFARELLKGVTEQEFYDLGLGFFLHDIGKSLIPLKILHKKGSLNEEEWAIMKTHPEMGYKILEDTGFIKKESALIVMQHHERGDGSGYPRGLMGDDIHVFGKICSLADTFDAMTTKRCYQRAYSAFEACNIIKENIIHKEFDKDFFSKFIRLFSNEKTVMK